jgi:hypothetical protein
MENTTMRCMLPCASRAPPLQRTPQSWFVATRASTILGRAFPLFVHRLTLSYPKIGRALHCVVAEAGEVQLLEEAVAAHLGSWEEGPGVAALLRDVIRLRGAWNTGAKTSSRPTSHAQLALDFVLALVLPPAKQHRSIYESEGSGWSFEVLHEPSEFWPELQPMIKSARKKAELPQLGSASQGTIADVVPVAELPTSAEKATPLDDVIDEYEPPTRSEAPPAPTFVTNIGALASRVRGYFAGSTVPPPPLPQQQVPTVHVPQLPDDDAETTITFGSPVAFEAPRANYEAANGRPVEDESLADSIVVSLWTRFGDRKIASCDCVFANVQYVFDATSGALRSAETLHAFGTSTEMPTLPPPEPFPMPVG